MTKKKKNNNNNQCQREEYQSTFKTLPSLDNSLCCRSCIAKKRVGCYVPHYTACLPWLQLILAHSLFGLQRFL